MAEITTRTELISAANKGTISQNINTSARIDEETIDTKTLTFDGINIGDAAFNKVVFPNLTTLTFKNSKIGLQSFQLAKFKSLTSIEFDNTEIGQASFAKATFEVLQNGKVWLKNNSKFVADGAFQEATFKNVDIEQPFFGALSAQSVSFLDADRCKQFYATQFKDNKIACLIPKDLPAYDDRTMPWSKFEGCNKISINTVEHLILKLS